MSVSYLVVASDRRAGAAGVMLDPRAPGRRPGSNLDRFRDPGRASRIWRALGRPLGPRPDLRLDARAASWALASDTRLNEAVPAKDLSTTEPSPVAAMPLASLRRADAAKPSGDVGGEDVSRGTLADHLAEVTARIGLRVADDAAYLEAQFAYLDSLGERVVCRLVRRSGRPIGWYAYLLRPTSSRVLCVAAEAA